MYEALFSSITYSIVEIDCTYTECSPKMPFYVSRKEPLIIMSSVRARHAQNCSFRLCNFRIRNFADRDCYIHLYRNEPMSIIILFVVRTYSYKLSKLYPKLNNGGNFQLNIQRVLQIGQWKLRVNRAKTALFGVALFEYPL